MAGSFAFGLSAVAGALALARTGRRARGRIPRRIRPNPPTPDGRAEKRFPCCAVRRRTRRALARAFGEFAPRADSGLRGAGQADADGGEPAPREPRENHPWTRRECSGG